MHRVLSAAEVWLPVDRLVKFAASLGNGYRVVPADLGLMEENSEGEGPTVTASNAYRDQGFDGAGIHIGVIDARYAGFLGSWETGDLPQSFLLWDLSSEGIYAGTSSHGRFVAETVFDQAPVLSTHSCER